MSADTAVNAAAVRALRDALVALQNGGDVRRALARLDALIAELEAEVNDGA